MRMSKRQAAEALAGENDGGGSNGPNGEPPRKRVVFEPLQLGPIANLDQLDLKTLQFQNHKLSLRLTQRMQIEEDLRSRIDQLEKRQTQDDAVINVIHRYWNQLNEDIRILLQRFDAETGDESEKNNEDDSTTSFLTQLATWHKQELDEKLASRVQVSQRAVAKIIQVFDHMIQRNDKLSRGLRGDKDVPVDDDVTDKTTNNGGDGGKLNDIITSPDVVGSGKDLKDDSKLNDVEPLKALDKQVIEWNQKLVSENKNLHQLNTSLHEKNHFLSLKQAEFEEQINAEKTKNEELQNKLDDLEYEVTKARMRNGKLESTLAETQSKLKVYVDRDGGKFDASRVITSTDRRAIDQLSQELEEQRELAANRLAELEATNENYKCSLKEVERYKMELSTLPEHVIVETTEHKCLQSQFSVLYNEAMQLKTQLEEARSHLQMAKNAHMRQIEQMESEELLAQKKLRTEVIQLEDMLAQVRKEYEMLRIEFEQNLAANEQTGPINKEMRNLISSLQTHNMQLKGEVARYKRKFKESNAEISKLRRDLDEMRTAEIKALQAKKLEREERMMSEEHTDDSSGGGAAPGSGGNGGGGGENANSGPISLLATDDNLISQDSCSEGSPNGLLKIKSDPDEVVGDETQRNEDSPDSSVAPGTPIKTDKIGTATPIKKEIKSELGITGVPAPAPISKEFQIKMDELKRLRGSDQDTIKDLKAQLKRALNDVKEMKLLLDMYKTCTKEQRDKAQLMAAEKKVRAELEDTRSQLKKIREAKREEKKRLADEDATRRIRQLEEQCATLQKQVANHKQEEEALLNEMEVTGQAFEDMQEQNSRLIQQLREKDDANFKLMSERIKSNQIQRLAREERDMLTQQVNTLSTQVGARGRVVRKLEEKERLLQNNLAALDKELAMRQQAMEMHKRKAIESAQSAADLKLHLEKYHAQIKEMQQTVAEKTSALEAEAFKTKRLHEELVLVKRKVERLRKIEMASDMDEILKEEIREYKETLTCPSCKVKRKDAVLTKCFHCFCYDCLRTRYETRQRKCPKCNAAFGASDYHRLYLA